MGVWPPPQGYTTQFLTLLESVQTSTTHTKQLPPQESLDSTGLGYRESRGWSNCIPQVDAKERSAPSKKDCVCSIKVWLSTRIQAVVPLNFLPRAIKPCLFSHNSSLLLPISLLESRVSGWFIGPLGVCQYLQQTCVSPLQTESPHNQMLCGSSSQYWCSRHT